MEIVVPFGHGEKRLTVNLPRNRIVLAERKHPTPLPSWCEAVREAIRSPIGASPIRAARLRGKKAVIIVDDWARPTPAYEMIPVVLDELRATGVEKRDITFVAACGMHDPMSDDDMARKVGPDIAREYRCIVHDAGKPGDVVLVGITRNGTPAWVNRHVGEADYKIGIGRICPHETHGYEGSYKLILPGVSGYDTIARNHSLNFAADCSGTPASPSRRDTDEVGGLVGIDFLINGVTDHAGQLFALYCGEPTAVYRSGVEFGDREVWGAEVGEPADIVVASPGAASTRRFTWDSRADLLTFYRVARNAREAGTVVFLAQSDAPFPVAPPGGVIDDQAASALRGTEFANALPSLSFAEIVRLHEKRNWGGSARDVMWRMRILRDEFLRRRRLEEIGKRRPVVTPDAQRAIDAALGQMDQANARVIVIPEAESTLAKETLFRLSR